jgi:AmmeMemoRadiSam system protein B
MKSKHIEKIYLDTNVYCRSFDNQENERIHEEAEAFLRIVEDSEKGELIIISSDYARFEIEQIPNHLKRKDVRSIERILSSEIVRSNRKLRTLAQDLAKICVLGSLDALHIAAACLGRADYLLTCDDEIIGKASCIEMIVSKKGYRLKVRNPVMYLEKRGELKKK